MPDPTQQTPPATAGALDVDALVSKVTAAMHAKFDAKFKPLSDKLDAIEKQPKTDGDQQRQQQQPGKPGDADKLTKADVDRMVKEQLDAATQQATSKQARDTYAADKLKDLPSIYRERLGNDPAKWAAEEQTIRATARDDFAAMGGKTPSVSGAPAAGTAGGQPPAAGVNLDANSAQTNIAAGLRTPAK